MFPCLNVETSSRPAPTHETYLALSRANSASNLSLQAKNVSRATGSPCGTTICRNGQYLEDTYTCEENISIYSWVGQDMPFLSSIIVFW